MKVLVMMVAFLSLGVSSAIASSGELLDGSWFKTKCYGCKGDEVVKQVKSQQADYDEAALAAAKNQKAYAASGGSDTAYAALVESLSECVSLSLFSYVKTQYEAELGRLAKVDGDKEGAIDHYKKSLKYAQAAQELADNPDWLGRDGANVPKRSQEEGAKFEKIARSQLTKLGVDVSSL